MSGRAAKAADERWWCAVPVRASSCACGKALDHKPGWLHDRVRHQDVGGGWRPRSNEAKPKSTLVPKKALLGRPGVRHLRATRRRQGAGSHPKGGEEGEHQDEVQDDDAEEKTIIAPR